LVKDISGNSTSSIFGKVHVWGDKLLFFAGARTSYYEEAGLWISDGTSQGTRRLMIAAPDPWYDAESNDGPMFAELDGRIYFTAKTEEDGQELWSTDGTVDGTQRVKDIFPGSAGSEPEWLTSTGGEIYFTANDGRHGRELWRTDGTADGTVLVKDFTMDAASSLPQGLAYTGGRLFFMATTPDAGAAAWVIDQP
jgi:ELWxxDGT repeat protein